MPNKAGKAIRIEFTPTFKRNLKALARKYRHIRSDVQPIIEQLQAGSILGDQVQGVGYTIFKVRIRNSDIQKGKSAGYRMIYYLKANDSIILSPSTQNLIKAISQPGAFARSSTKYRNPEYESRHFS